MTRSEPDPDSAARRHAAVRFIETQRRRSNLPLADAVRAGLGARPKTLPSQFFYDETGSKLFEEICELPEYYLTRAEREILERAAPELARMLPEVETLIELGSGSAVKTELLLQAFERSRGQLRYAPVDVSRTALEESTARLAGRHPELEILAAIGEYESGIAALEALELGPTLVLWLGSSIGNLRRDAAARFLDACRASLAEHDRMLVGIDLRKDAAILEAAYDDDAGVTARFDLNLLARINRELGGDFDLDRFTHRVNYEPESGAVQSFLQSESEQSVWIDALDLEVTFEAGERIHTEDSVKYSPEEIESLAAAAGFALVRQDLDEARRFSLNLLAPVA